MAPSRDAALALLQQHIANPNLVKHCLASEAVMRALAPRFNADADLWGMAGLLHDIDVEVTNNDLNVHGLKATELLRPFGLDEECITAIRRHNEQACREPRSTPFEHALAAGETITGLVTATTLVYPDKKLASVKSSSVVKRMKEKLFAASVNRDIIRECETIGIPLPEFAEIAVKAMQGISNDLGL